MAYERDESELGALWAKTSAKGVEFLSGTINGVEVVCFKVTKPTERGPTWRVLKSQPRDQAGRAPMRATADERDERVYDERASQAPNYEDDGF